MSFDKAEQKIEKKAKYDVDIAKMVKKYPMKYLSESNKWIKLSDVLAVLGDLHHAWCAEAQKTVKAKIIALEIELKQDKEDEENFEDSIRTAVNTVRTQSYRRGYRDGLKEKAEKLLESAKR